MVTVNANKCKNLKTQKMFLKILKCKIHKNAKLHGNSQHKKRKNVILLR